MFTVFVHKRNAESGVSLEVLEEVDPPLGVALPDVPEGLELVPALRQVLAVERVLRRVRALHRRAQQLATKVLQRIGHVLQ